MIVVRIFGAGIVITAGVLLWLAEPWNEQSRDWPGVASVVAFTEADVLFSGVVWDRRRGFTRVNLGLARRAEPATRSGAGMRWGHTPSGHGVTTDLWGNQNFLVPAMSSYPLPRNHLRRPLWVSGDRRSRSDGPDSVLLTGFASGEVPEFVDSGHKAAFERAIELWRQPENGVAARGEFAIAGSFDDDATTWLGATRRDDGTLLVRIEGASKGMVLDCQVHYPDYSLEHRQSPDGVIQLVYDVPANGALVLRLLGNDRVVAGLAFLGPAIALDARHPSLVADALMRATRQLGGPGTGGR